MNECSGPCPARGALSLIGDLTSWGQYQHDLMVSGQPNELSFALNRIQQIHDIVRAASHAEARRIVESWPEWKRNIGHRLDPIPLEELP